MKKLSYVFLFLFIITGFYSCKKSKSKENAPAETNEPKYFEVSFTKQTIDIDKIDSVTIELSNACLNKPIKHKLEKKATSFNLSIDNLQAGNWNIAISVYESFDEKSRRKYILKKNVSISNPNQFQAPVVRLNNEWIPYIILTTPNKEVELIISELQDHPLIEINTYDGEKFDYAYLDRSIFGTSQYDQLDFEYWEDFKNEMPRKIINDKAFSNYSERTKTKKWNTSSLYLVMSGKNFFELYYYYNNRYKN